MAKYIFIISLFLIQSCSTFQGIKTRREIGKKQQKNIQEISVNKGHMDEQSKFADGDMDEQFSRSSQLEIIEIEKSKLKDEEIADVKDVVKKDVKSKVVKSNPESQLFQETLDLRYSPKLYKWWISFFTKREKARFNRHLNNGIKYKKLIKSIFKEHGLPSDLYYVGLIESGFNTYVRSHAGATGPWQFMRGTAKNYGLRVDSYVDERANLVKATHAAARYFKDLYNIFNSWELALCAYNAGEYRIVGAIRRGNTRDYRELVKKKLLPKETIYYIPKVAAAKTIIDQPEKYGFKVKYDQINPYEGHTFKKISNSFNQKKMARVLGTSYSKFKEVNPDFRRQDIQVWSKRKGIEILVSNNNKVNLASSEVINAYKIKAQKGGAIYRVRRGDNLSTIARKFGTSVRNLKSLNRLRGSRIYVGQKLKTGNTSSSDASRVAKRKTSKKKKIIAKNKTKKSSSPLRHVVKRGENLTRISRLYGVSISSIKAQNRLRRSKIMVGQRLRIPSSDHSYYTVRRGDNLSKIAAKFGLKISSIKRANNLRGSRIYVGQKVVIPSNG